MSMNFFMLIYVHILYFVNICSTFVNQSLQTKEKNHIASEGSRDFVRVLIRF